MNYIKLYNSESGDSVNTIYDELANGDLLRPYIAVLKDGENSYTVYNSNNSEPIHIGFTYTSNAKGPSSPSVEYIETMAYTTKDIETWLDLSELQETPETVYGILNGDDTSLDYGYVKYYQGEKYPEFVWGESLDFEGLGGSIVEFKLKRVRFGDYYHDALEDGYPSYDDLVWMIECVFEGQ